jgi:hypothetical protein
VPQCRLSLRRRRAQAAPGGVALRPFVITSDERRSPPPPSLVFKRHGHALACACMLATGCGCGVAGIRVRPQAAAGPPPSKSNLASSEPDPATVCFVPRCRPRNALLSTEITPCSPALRSSAGRAAVHPAALADLLQRRAGAEPRAPTPPTPGPKEQVSISNEPGLCEVISVQLWDADYLSSSVHL